MRRTAEVRLADACTFGVRRRIGVGLKHGARRMNSPLPKRFSAQANPTVGANLFAVARTNRQLMRCDGLWGFGWARTFDVRRLIGVVKRSEEHTSELQSR